MRTPARAENPALRNIAGGALSGMLSGGVTALITGGDFWEGVAIGGATGLAGAGLSQAAAKWLNGKPAAKKPTQETKQIDIEVKKLDPLADLSAEIAQRGHTQLLLAENNAGTANGGNINTVATTEGKQPGMFKLGGGDGLGNKIMEIPANGSKRLLDKGNFIEGLYFRGGYSLNGNTLDFDVKIFQNMDGHSGGMSKVVAKAEGIAKQLGATNININFHTTINANIYNNQVINKMTGQVVITNWAAKHGYKFYGGGGYGSLIQWKK